VSLSSLNLSKILIDGTIFSFIASGYLLAVLWLNPRLFLQDYPKDVQEKVPPKSPTENRLATYFGSGFLLILILGPFLSTLSLKISSSTVLPFEVLFIHTFGVASLFNLVDWIILDWLLFCTIQPKFMIIPGTDNMAGYKDYFMHFRGFIIGSLISALGAIIIAAVVYFI